MPALYPIRAVAKLTGIPVDTLRACGVFDGVVRGGIFILEDLADFDRHLIALQTGWRSTSSPAA